MHPAAVAVVAGAVAPTAAAPAAAIAIAASTLQANRRTNERTNPGASCKLQRYIFFSLCDLVTYVMKMMIITIIIIINA